MNKKQREAFNWLDSAAGRHFLLKGERISLMHSLRGEEGNGMAELVLNNVQIIEKTPVTYSQDGLGMDAVVHLHYFTPGGDWYITEKCSSGVPEPGDYDQAFGFCCPFGKEDGELGYCSIQEMTEAGAQLDLHWTPKTLKEVME